MWTHFVGDCITVPHEQWYTTPRCMLRRIATRNRSLRSHAWQATSTTRRHGSRSHISGIKEQWPEFDGSRVTLDEAAQLLAKVSW